MTKTLAPDRGAASGTAELIYKLLRVLAIVSIIFLFIPTLNPARVSGLINQNTSLFTSGVSYGQLTNGFSKAFRKNWISEGTMVAVMISSLVTFLGIAADCGGMACTLGSHRLQRIGTGLALGGADGGRPCGAVQLLQRAVRYFQAG